MASAERFQHRDSTNPASPLCDPAAGSEAGGECPLPSGESRWRAKPVEGIHPVDGWTLCAFTEDDPDGFQTTAYVARGPDRDVWLDVSRFRFSPSQDRFAWMVKHGFPPCPYLGPWDDTDIDMRLTVEALA